MLGRITRSLKMHIYNLRWLAKLNFSPDVSFEFRELRQFGKFLTDLPGLACAWVVVGVVTLFPILAIVVSSVSIVPIVVKGNSATL